MPQLNPSTLTSRDNTSWVGGDNQDLVNTVSRRWDWSPIDESLWSANWPYQLAVLEAQDDGGYMLKDAYTLPINPESLVNAMPFANVLQATFGGVVENSGGVPLRPIVLTGNLGVINDRDSGDSLGGLLFQLGGIAGGTIQAGQQAIVSAENVGQPQFTQNLYNEAIPTATSGVPNRSTGYYQWLFLQRFMESYAERKKEEAGGRLRLALYIWKEQAVYLVSPELLQLTRSNDKPVEYQYTFKCTAYARVHPDNIIGSEGVLGGAPFNLVTTAGSRSALSNALDAIQRARYAVMKFKNLAIAVNADFDATVGGTLRSVGLLLKDAIGVAKTWSDFPDSIKNTAYRIINEDALIFQNLLRNGPSKTPSSAAKLVTLTVDTSSIDDLAVDSLTNSTPELRRAMAKETARVRSLTTHDFRQMRAQVESFNSFFAAKVGVGDPRNTNQVQVLRQATDDDFRLMNALAESTDAISQMTVVQQQMPETSLLDYVAGLASAAGINMRRALSKFAVPFPYGATLEQLSLQYLGDATRWGEIAALNELHQPYIDEVGQDQFLLANGNGNDIVISDGSLLQIDHLVAISSKQVLPESRRVVAIRELAPGYWSVTLSGNEDLYRFKLADSASIHFSLPNTVNSSQVIFIPSGQVTTNTDLQFRFVPTLSDLERILQVGGVDGALTDSGDIAITQDGDWPYVQGLATLIQWARVALNTPLRSWPLYPTFGIDIQVGQSIADTSAQDILRSIKNSFRLNGAFTGVLSAAINIDGPTTQVTLELGVRGVDSTLPVTFNIAQ